MYGNFVQKDYFLVYIASGFPHVSESVPQLSGPIEGRRTKELEQLKCLSLKIQEAASENVAILIQKESNMMSGESYIPTRTFTYKNYPCYWLYRWTVIQCNGPVIENTLVDDRYELENNRIIKITKNTYKLLQINFDGNTFT